ncbi:MAG: hypothetical protein ABSC53_06235 [Bacteroidota bacterium]|jgi:hypothetical protein
MKSKFKLIISILVLVCCGSFNGFATPSTQIWIPSTDIQSFKVWHLGIDNYFYDYKNGTPQSLKAFPTDIGMTVGVLPFTAIQVEVGVDFFVPQLSPLSFNAKIGIPEGTLTDWAPAIAAGGFDFGLQKNVTDYNILYGVVAKTLPVVGRLSIGYYSGNSTLLFDQNGNADNTGVLLSWDRQITEISENLWVAVDYQGGKSGFGALNIGFAWSFSKNVSVIFARDIFNNNALPSTFTTQLDINI